MGASKTNRERPMDKRPLPNTLKEKYKPVKRYMTHIEPLDACFADPVTDELGLCVGSITVLTGQKGMGKSTLMLQMMDGLVGNNCLTLLATAEQSRGEVIGIQKRIGLKNGIHFIIDNKATAQDIGAYADALMDQYEGMQLVLGVDSLQVLTDGDRNHTYHAFRKIEEFAKRSKAICFLINHLRKDGQLGGSSYVEAMCSTVMEVKLAGDYGSDSRRILIGKNRQGRGFCQVDAVVKMEDKKGLVFTKDTIEIEEHEQEE